MLDLRRKHNDEGEHMNDIRLTRRGKIVLGIVVAALSIITYSLLMDIVTPAECKVPFEQMSQGCIDTIYR